MGIINTINTHIKNIDKIYHVSDIHIRTLKRHKEYREVFNNLQKYIKDTATENSIAVVTGDIVHSKLDMSPELIQMLVEFFNGFTIPTIVILGNHDMNLNNMHRIDAVSPILDVINNDNIIFIKDNGLFGFANVVFNHMAVDVAPTEYIKASDFTADYKIALHHGAVNTAKTDIGYVISNEHVTTALFDGHDITLLGDIHKPAQFLNDEKTIAYPGSLIQQNFGEELIHGILVWDVPARSAEFVEIHNDYGYVTFEMKGTSIIKQPDRVPLKPRVRLVFSGTSAADIKKTITLFRSKYQVQDISISRKSDTTVSNSAIDLITIGNVRDTEYQNKIITEYIEVKYPNVSNEELDAIRHINRTINSKLPALDSIRHTTWHPISFEFDNMFSYGEGNIINFENLNGIAGLFAANTSGKSSLLDAITYTIFDKCSKTGKAHEVLNNKKSEFRGKFVFEMNGIIYTIIREGIKKKDNHVKINVDFYTDSENLNGEERSETNKNIRKYLGTYDDFILTAFSLQADNNNFIEKSQRERKDLLSQFLDITVFEQLYSLANDEIKETSGKLKEYKKTDFASIITLADEIIIGNQDIIISLESEEHELQEARNVLQSDILILMSEKLPTTYTGDSLTDLIKKEDTLVTKIEDTQNDIESKENILNQIKDKTKDLKTSISLYNETELKEHVELYDSYLEKINKLEQLKLKQQGIINEKQTKIDHLAEHEYDPNCEYCTANIFVQNAIEAKNTIEDDKQLLEKIQNQINDDQQLLDNYSESVDKYKTLSDLKSKFKSLIELKEKQDLTIQLAETELQTLETELELNLEKQNLYKQNNHAITVNEEIDLSIADKKLKIEKINSELKQIALNIKNTHGKIEVAKTNKKHAMANLEAYHKLEIEYKAFEYYLNSVSRDGVPYDIISKALPKIEMEINNVLNQIVDFNMTLQTDGKNINGYIIYDEDNFWPLELTSGMERFLSSLAIRIALINVSALPRPNFIAIDEGWGSLDAEHISSVVNLFDYFRNKFDFSIIISHVDSMRDMVDTLIEVNKINKLSHISHT